MAAWCPAGLVAVAAALLAATAMPASFAAAAHAQPPVPPPASDATVTLHVYQSEDDDNPIQPSASAITINNWVNFETKDAVLESLEFQIQEASIIYGTSIDQGIAYVLMLIALVLTYLIHPLDASSPYKLF